MERTINGKSLPEFFAALGKKMPVSTKDGSDTQYIGIDAVEQRVSELTLPSNYSFECSNPASFESGKRVTFIVNAKLTLIDDSGNVVCVREVPGGSDLSYLKNDSEKAANDLKSYVAAAKSNAFVNCWISMGLGDKSELNFGKTGNKEPKGAAKKTVVTITSAFSYADHAKLLKADAMVDGKKCVFKIFSDGLDWLCNKYQKDTADIVKCFSDNYGPGKRETYACIGRLEAYKGDLQFAFVKEE